VSAGTSAGVPGTESNQQATYYHEEEPFQRQNIIRTEQQPKGLLRQKYDLPVKSLYVW
jgi:hypothetical protein